MPTGDGWRFVVGVDYSDPVGGLIYYAAGPDGLLYAIDPIQPFDPARPQDAWLPGFPRRAPGDPQITFRTPGTLLGPEPPAPGSGDILDRIDQAVASAHDRAADVEAIAEEVVLCGCGCGVPVPPDATSRDFATYRCQQVWHERQATDPADVYKRTDAHVAIATELLVEELEATARVRQALAAQPPRPVRVMLPPCADDFGAAYRRHCGPCGRMVIPDVYQMVPRDTTSRWERRQDAELIEAHGEIGHECPTCGWEMPGPAFIATVVHDKKLRQLMLELSHGQARIQQPVSLSQFRYAPHGDRFFRMCWSQLERGLQRFLRTWQGRHATPPGGA